MGKCCLSTPLWSMTSAIMIAVADRCSYSDGKEIAVSIKKCVGAVGEFDCIDSFIKLGFLYPASFFEGVNMRISDMYFGSTDANSELNKLGPEAFRDLFQLVPGYDVEKMLDGTITYIRGDKGTGKTMLLRYAELVAKERACPTRFIRYKRSITDNDLRALRQAGNNPVADEYVTDDASNAEAKSTNYVLGWQLYLIREIIDLSKNSETRLFDKCSGEWGEINSVLDEIYGSSAHMPSKRLLPKLKKGMVYLKTQHFGLDLEFDRDQDRGGYYVPFAEVVKYVIRLYEEIPCVDTSCPMYIFIDEIELHYGRKKEYERDLKLVGDLVIASSYLNDISRERNRPIYTSIALRNEIFQSSVTLGCELNKPIEDYGMQVKWGGSYDSDDENPLLQMIEKRFRRNLDVDDPRRDNIWSEFFPEFVEDVPVRAYILKQTWQKPRDIIRLLMTLQKSNFARDTITERAFLDIRKEYSVAAWREIKEELTAVYQNDAIDAICKVLNGINSPFNMNDFIHKMNQASNDYSSVENLRERYKAPELINVLFKFGIIGNIQTDSKASGRARFSAYGEDEPDLAGSFVIHYPLRSVFDIRAQ